MAMARMTRPDTRERLIALRLGRLIAAHEALRHSHGRGADVLGQDLCGP
jgi:hypothetical protein